MAADFTMDDVIAALKQAVAPYDSNTNLPPKSKADINTTTKGDIEAATPADGNVIQFIKDYLANIGKTATIPARTALTGGAAALDGLKNVGAAALGGRLAEPQAHTNDAVAGLKAAADPLLSGFRSIPSRRDIGEKMGLVYDAEPAGAFGGNPEARTVSEGVPSSGPVPAMPAEPQMRTSQPAIAPRGGAFARTSTEQPAVNDVAPPSPATAEPVAKEGAFAQTAPQSFKSMAEEFRRRSGEMNRDPDGKLTKEQKANAELNFFLGLMSKSAKPGARMLGAFGESGQEALKAAGEQQDKNMTRSERKLQRQRDDLYREMGFAYKDDDNKRGDRRQAAEEKRWQATDRNDSERLQLLRDQFEQGKLSVQKTNRGLMLVNSKTGESKPLIGSDGKQLQPHSESGGQGAEERLLRALTADPALFETAMKLKGRDQEKGSVTEKDVFENVMRNLRPDPATGKAPNQNDVLRIAQDIVRQQRGGAPAADSVASPKSQAEFDKLPSGAKYINPKDGKTYTKK